MDKYSLRKLRSIYAIFKVQEDGDKKRPCGFLLLYTGKSRNMTEHTKSQQESETLVDESDCNLNHRILQGVARQRNTAQR